MLSPESVLKYQTIYRKVYGEAIDEQTAKEQGERLINFMRVVMESTDDTSNEEGSGWALRATRR